LAHQPGISTDASSGVLPDQSAPDAGNGGGFGIAAPAQPLPRHFTMTPPDQFPSIVTPGALATPTDTYIVPALIAYLGDAANWRYVEFFTANINNDHTRRAYARACNRFFAWCENRGLSLTAIRLFDVAAWVKDLQQTHGAPGVKQQLATVRMLFDWLITGQIVPMNPAAAVRGPKHVVKTGKTPVLEGERNGANYYYSPRSRPRPCAICATAP
jgi:hypothetical protein